MQTKYLLVSSTFTMVLASACLPKTVQAGYGTSSESTTTTAAVVCTSDAPAKPTFSFVRKSGEGEIEIGWNATERATKWTVAYGHEKGKYIYGAADFGDENSRSTKIAMLPAGTYYLVVKASNGCMPGAFSDERKMTVTTGGLVLGAKSIRSYLPAVLGDSVVSSPIQEPSPSVVSSPTPSFVPATAPLETVKELNWFQRLIKKIFGL